MEDLRTVRINSLEKLRTERMSDGVPVGTTPLLCKKLNAKNTLPCPRTRKVTFQSQGLGFRFMSDLTAQVSHPPPPFDSNIRTITLSKQWMFIHHQVKPHNALSNHHSSAVYLPKNHYNPPWRFNHRQSNIAPSWILDLYTCLFLVSFNHVPRSNIDGCWWHPHPTVTPLNIRRILTIVVESCWIYPTSPSPTLASPKRSASVISRISPQSSSTGFAPPGALGSSTSRTLPAWGSAWNMPSWTGTAVEILKCPDSKVDQVLVLGNISC